MLYYFTCLLENNKNNNEPQRNSTHYKQKTETDIKHLCSHGVSNKNDGTEMLFKLFLLCYALTMTFV